MKINPQATNIAQSYSNNSALNSKTKDSEQKTDETVSLNVSSVKEQSNIDDIDSIKERVQDISKQLNVDYKKESANFSKNNITFFEGSFLTSQSTNIQQSAVRLLSE